VEKNVKAFFRDLSDLQFGKMGQPQKNIRHSEIWGVCYKVFSYPNAAAIKTVKKMRHTFCCLYLCQAL